MRRRACLLDKTRSETKKLSVQWLAPQMGANHTKPYLHLPDEFASGICRSTTRLGRREKPQSFLPCPKNWVGRIKTGQLEDAFDLASE